MKHLNTIETSLISGGLKLNSAAQGACAGLLTGLAIAGTQRLLIDALKPVTSFITDVGSFSVFIGSNFGSKEHLSHLITATLATGIVATLGGFDE